MARIDTACSAARERTSYKNSPNGGSIDERMGTILAGIIPSAELQDTATIARMAGLP